MVPTCSSIRPFRIKNRSILQYAIISSDIGQATSKCTTGSQTLHKTLTNTQPSSRTPPQKTKGQKPAGEGESLVEERNAPAAIVIIYPATRYKHSSDEV